MTGRDFLIKNCDEKLWEDNLNDEGIAFTRYYYNNDTTSGSPNYYSDYAETLATDDIGIYEVQNTWKNYEKIKRVITKRYMDWKKNT